MENSTGAESNPTRCTMKSDDITLSNLSKTGYTFSGRTGMGITEISLDVKIPAGSGQSRI